MTLDVPDTEINNDGSTLVAALGDNAYLLMAPMKPTPRHPLPRPPPAPDRHRPAERHLATTSGTSTTRNHAAQLLQRRNQLLDRLRDIADTPA